jgi:hypothetical protein
MMHHHNTRHFRLNIDAEMVEAQDPNAPIWLRSVRVKEAQLANRMDAPALREYLESLPEMDARERSATLAQKVRELDCSHPEEKIVTDTTQYDRRDPADYDQRVICAQCLHEFGADELAERYPVEIVEEVEF